MTIESSKFALRQKIKLLREDLEFSEYRKSSSSIMENCFSLPEWKSAETVHCYVSSVNNEVDTLGIILTMLDQGKRVVVPKCQPSLRRIQNIRIKSLNELNPVKGGLMEPEYTRINEISPENIDLILAPLLAFDRNGNRLGFGGGYYDSFFIESTCPKVGLGYSFQEVPAVPVDPRDQPLNIILSEKEVIRIEHNE